MRLRIFGLYYSFTLAVAFFLEFTILTLTTWLSGMTEAAIYAGGAAGISLLFLIYMAIRVQKSHMPLARQVAYWVYPLSALSVLVIAGALAYCYWASLTVRSLNPLLLLAPGLAIVGVICIKSFEIRFLTDYDELRDRLARPRS